MPASKKSRTQINCIGIAMKKNEKFPHQFPLMRKCNEIKKFMKFEQENNKQNCSDKNSRLQIFNSIIYKFKKIGAPPNKLILIGFILLFIQFPIAYGACREEPSRDCEAVCTDIGNTTVIGAPGYYGNNCIIRAVVLLPDDNNHVAALNRVLPVLKVAEEQIREDQLIPPNIRFEWLAKDDKCDAAYAVIKAMDGTVKSCAHVLFGPVCDYALGKYVVFRHKNKSATKIFFVSHYLNF